MLKFTSGERIGEYRIIKLIRQGGMSSVVLVENKGLYYALKVSKIDADPTRSRENSVAIREEATLLHNMIHERIVKIFPIAKKTEAMRNSHGRQNYYANAIKMVIGEQIPVYYAMEYLEGGTLSNFIKYCGPLKVAEATNIIGNIGLGLAYMHKKGLSHNDVKLENVVFRKKIKNGMPYDPVLIDFGTATGVKGFEDYAGTWYIMAPERIRIAKGIDPPEAMASLNPTKSDVWSLGILLYQALTKTLPFPSIRENRLTSQILNNEPKNIIEYNKNVPKELNDFILFDCLAKNPKNRPTIKELLGYIYGYCGSGVKAESLKKNYYNKLDN